MPRGWRKPWKTSVRMLGVPIEICWTRHRSSRNQKALPLELTLSGDLSDWLTCFECTLLLRKFHVPMVTDGYTTGRWRSASTSGYLDFLATKSALRYPASIFRYISGLRNHFCNPLCSWKWSRCHVLSHRNFHPLMPLSPMTQELPPSSEREEYSTNSCRAL
jgi:hypothetical protein